MQRTALLLVLTLLACGEPPARTPQKSSGEVPANSLSDAQLHGTNDPKGHDSPNDPTQPLTTKVGEAPFDPDAPSPSASGGTASKPPPGGGKGAVSKAECDRAFDKYLQLEMAGNPQLKGLPPEVLEQVREQGKKQHGEAPCTSTRTQYNCAMAATTTAGWQKCMK